MPAKEKREIIYQQFAFKLQLQERLIAELIDKAPEKLRTMLEAQYHMINLAADSKDEKPSTTQLKQLFEDLKGFPEKIKVEVEKHEAEQREKQRLVVEAQKKAEEAAKVVERTARGQLREECLGLIKKNRETIDKIIILKPEEQRTCQTTLTRYNHEEAALKFKSPDTDLNALLVKLKGEKTKFDRMLAKIEKPIIEDLARRSRRNA